MATLDTTHIDLECGRRSTTSGGEEEEEVGSVCFSDGFCNSQILDDEDSFVDLEIGTEKIETNNLINLERDCRICHLSLISNSPGPGPDSGVAIELGCSCKGNLAEAHKQCAETWFKIKGNKTCEICNTVARNVVGPNDTEAAQQATERNMVGRNDDEASEQETESSDEANTPSSDRILSTVQVRTSSNDNEACSFLLFCMMLGLVVYWFSDSKIFT